LGGSEATRFHLPESSGLARGVAVRVEASGAAVERQSDSPQADSGIPE
jgi:hypothetical protein